jgi:hypothetical protein
VDELRDELKNLHHLKETVSGVTSLFDSLRLLHADLKISGDSHAPFNESGLELIEQAIVKKEDMLRKVRELHE